MSHTTATPIAGLARLLLPQRRFAPCVIAGFALSVPLFAQHPNSTPQIQNHTPIGQIPDSREQEPSQNQEMLERLHKARETDRQRRMVDDAKRLVELTSQYQKLVEAHGTPTVDDQKLLVQIEKLARDVKDRMRGM